MGSHELTRRSGASAPQAQVRRSPAPPPYEPPAKAAKPERPALHDKAAAPVMVKMPPPAGVRLAQICWVLSLVVGAIAVGYLFVIRQSIDPSSEERHGLPKRGYLLMVAANSGATPAWQCRYAGTAVQIRQAWSSDPNLSMEAGVDSARLCQWFDGLVSSAVPASRVSTDMFADLVALGMNLFTQGIDPEVDFSDIDQVKRTVEYCNQLPVPERQPWAGDLVYTAFSGSHQDAINKGFEAMKAKASAAGKSVDDIAWAVPYLPVDPKDIGRSYEAVIRVNSQSGKGGVAYLLKTDHAIDLPRKLQIEFSGVVQQRTDSEGGEFSSERIWDLFRDEYLPAADESDKWGRYEITKTATSSDFDGTTSLSVAMRVDEGEVTADAVGTGPIDAFLQVMAGQGVAVTLYDYSEHTMSASGDAQAASYVELDVDGTRLWGVGIDADIATASLKAIVSAVNRAVRAGAATGSPELVSA